MKKTLLLTLLLPILTFTNDMVVRVTPHVEVGSFIVLPKVTANVDAKVNVGKVNETNFEVGGGVSQGVAIVPLRSIGGKDSVIGDTQVYGLAEVNRHFTKDFTLYGQIKLGVGVGYWIAPRGTDINTNQDEEIIGIGSGFVFPMGQASLEGGIVYKKFNVGLNIGAPKIIALKLGYEIPVNIK